MVETGGHGIDEIRRVYGMLEDAESREIYLARLNYLITGNLMYIDHIVEKYLPVLCAERKGTIEDLVRMLPSDRPVVLYGAGGDGEQCLARFRAMERFVGLCDRDPEKQRKGFWGCTVLSPEQLLQDYREAAIVIGTTHFESEVAEFLRENGITDDQIFYASPYIHHELPESYFGMDFLHYGEREVFVDAGCYDLESTCLFLKHSARVEKVFAFEPDPSNYLRCEKIREERGLPEVHLCPSGTWSKETTMRFASEASPGSHIAAGDGVEVRMVPIDCVVGNEKVTFIKLDVEGSKLESLKGARATIQKSRPQMAVCIYHKPQDMVELPLYIKSLVPDYRLYVRHLGTSPYETVLYAV